MLPSWLNPNNVQNRDLGTNQIKHFVLGSSINMSPNENEEEILSVEAEKIEKIFIDEEKELTLNRPNLETSEFLKLANDFDKRVELERLNQRNKEAKINENLNIWKKKFFNIYMIPIIKEFMKIYEA